MLRWLLPLLTVFALLGQSVMVFAAAGTIGDPKCCCPVKAKCKCHDHDGKSQSSPTLKRCAGDAKLVAPAHAPVTPALGAEISSEPRITVSTVIAPDPIPDDVSYEPETPPF